MITLTLPYPPSVNKYWRMGGNGVFISAQGRGFRQAVVRILSAKNHKTLGERLRVEIEVYPPDKRKRDLDNVLKALLDALQSAQIFEDDEQIDHLVVRRSKVIEGGKIIVSVKEIESKTKK